MKVISQHKVNVNHVMSNDVRSEIFDSIIEYLKTFSSEGFNHYVSTRPSPDMDVYHYHRPNLESKLLRNSIVTVHHDLIDTDSWLPMEKFTDRYREASHILCLNTGQEKILNKEGIKNTSVVPHGYNSDIFGRLFEKKEFRSNKKLVLGVISRRYGRKVKGEAYIFELMKRLPTDRFQFIFVGQGRTEEAYMARSLGFDAKVYERLPYRVFGDLYRSIDFLLVTSLYEGGPANLPEAISSATPIITTRVGMAIDCITNWNNGVYISGNAESDLDIFEKISSNDSGCTSRLFNNAFYRQQEAISWRQNCEIVCEKYKYIYNNIDRN